MARSSLKMTGAGNPLPIAVFLLKKQDIYFYEIAFRHTMPLLINYIVKHWKKRFVHNPAKWHAL